MLKRIRRIAALGAAALVPAMLGLGALGAGPETPTPRPYPLATCPVSGEELGSMGDPVVQVYDGREVRFCCEKCRPKFEADQARYWGEIDEQIIAEQLPHYPLGACPVSGHELLSDEDHEPVNVVRDNRLIRLCCEDCMEDLEADPQAMMAEMDKMIADAQREDYPLTECIASDEALGSMGEPFEIVYANRLYRFCCDGCLGDFNEDPMAMSAKLDTAYADAQRESYPLKACVVSGEELGSMGDAYEVVLGTQLVQLCCEKCEGRLKKNAAKYLAEVEAGEE